MKDTVTTDLFELLKQPTDTENQNNIQQPEMERPTDVVQNKEVEQVETLDVEIPTSNIVTEVAVNQIQQVGDSPPNIPAYSSPPPDLIDGISLMEMEFPEPTVIVENLLHSGVSMIAGMPKVGKTWFCLSLSLAVATGTDIIEFKTNKSEVLYLSFESKAGQIQQRLKKMLQGEPMPNGIHFYTDIKTLDNGLLDFLQNTLNKYPKIKLIIVDTLQFIRSSKSGGGTLYQKEYKEMSKLKAFADKNNVCILAVHHLKNTPSKDVFAKMYGSNRY